MRAWWGLDGAAATIKAITRLLRKLTTSAALRRELRTMGAWCTKAEAAGRARHKTNNNDPISVQPFFLGERGRKGDKKTGPWIRRKKNLPETAWQLFLVVAA